MEPTSPGVAALRIQAAAVVAQQAAVFEDEARLQQNRLTFAQQQTQLAAILEDKRRRLVSLRDEVQNSRAALQLERTNFETFVAESTRRRDLELADISDEHSQLRTERRRLALLRVRLRKRMHRHWTYERAALRRREAELRKKRHQNDHEECRLAAEREALTQVRLRCNGEIEISRREITSLQEATQLERQRLADQAAELGHRERDVRQAHQALLQERQNWQRELVRLQNESMGLKNRIENQRGKLSKLEPKMLPNIMPAGAASPAPSAGDPPETVERAAELEMIADALTDQRARIVEQWQRFLHAQEIWSKERDTAAAQFADLAQALHERERAVESTETELRLRVVECEHQRRYLQGLQGQWTARLSAWHGERERVLSDLRGREELVEHQQSSVGELLQKWQHRYHEASQRLKAAFAACQQAREEYAGRRDEWIRRVEKRSAGDTAVELRALVQDELARLESEAVKIDDSFTQMKQWSDELAARDAELANLLATVEQGHHSNENETTRLRKLLAGVHSQQRSYERQIKELQEEIERLAQALMESDEIQSYGLRQAA